MRHCVATVYTNDEKKIPGSIRPSKDKPMREPSVSLQRNTGKDVKLSKGTLDSKLEKRSGFIRL